MSRANPYIDATSLPLGQTAKKTAAQLDFASLAALLYAQAWAVHRGGRKAPLSVVIRRAVMAYARHIETIAASEPTAPAAPGERPGPQSWNELQALKQAGQGAGARCLHSGPLTEDLAQALTMQRLDALPASAPDQPWPSFSGVLYGPEVEARRVAARAELDASVAAHLDAIARSPRGNAIGLRRHLVQPAE